MARGPWNIAREGRLLRDSYLATRPRERFQATTLAGILASAAQGGKERLLWRLKGLV